MKTVRSYLFVSLVGAAMLLIAGCATGTEHQLSAQKEMPGAAGNLNVDRDDNGNLKLNLEVDYMPPPAELDDNLENYVVWVQPSGSNRIYNVGALELNEDRQASLETLTPYESFTFTVSAESSPQASKPSDYVVFRRQIDAD